MCIYAILFTQYSSVQFAIESYKAIELKRSMLTFSYLFSLADRVSFRTEIFSHP